MNIAYGGSCTAGKREDFDHYHEVLRWGVEHGMQRRERRAAVPAIRHDGRARLLRASRAICRRFEAAGARILQPACGVCANCGPGQSTSAGEVTISAINRNFPGRSGPGQVWLASPHTVAASALAGRIVTFDALMRAG